MPLLRSDESEQGSVAAILHARPQRSKIDKRSGGDHEAVRIVLRQAHPPSPAGTTEYRST